MKFKQPNDEGIKKYLAGKLKEARERAEDFSIKFHNKSDEYEELTRHYGLVIAENDSLKEETKTIRNTNTMQSDNVKA